MIFRITIWYFRRNWPFYDSIGVKRSPLGRRVKITLILRVPKFVLKLKEKMSTFQKISFWGHSGSLMTSRSLYFSRGGDFSFVTIMDILRPAKTALTIFFKLCIPPFLGLKNFVLGFLRFKNWSIRPKIRPESLKKDHFFKKKIQKIWKNFQKSKNIYRPTIWYFWPQINSF